MNMIRKRKKNNFLWLLLISVMICSLVGCNSTSSEPSLRYTEIPMDMDKLDVLQAQVDQGHQPGNLDPEQVSREFINQSLQIDTDINLELQQSEKNIRIYKASINEQPEIEIYLVQPVRQGSGGIWKVKKYRRID